MRLRAFIISALVAVGVYACHMPRPSYALVVRDPQSKCALIAFSGCTGLTSAHGSTREDDAGSDDDAGPAR